MSLVAVVSCRFGSILLADSRMLLFNQEREIVSWNDNSQKLSFNNQILVGVGWAGTVLLNRFADGTEELLLDQINFQLGQAESSEDFINRLESALAPLVSRLDQAEDTDILVLYLNERNEQVVTHIRLPIGGDLVVNHYCMLVSDDGTLTTAIGALEAQQAFNNNLSSTSFPSFQNFESFRDHFFSIFQQTIDIADLNVVGGNTRIFELRTN